jgi:RNA polymerase sigma-70 factor (ECF subfamily)
MTPAELRATFLAAVDHAVREDSLDDALAALLAAGRAAWPDLPLDDAAFVRKIAKATTDGSLPPVEHAGELFLACACVAGTKGAAAAFEKTYRGLLERAIARVDRAGADEGTQVVLVSLLVTTPEGPPRIDTYGGRSSLRAWLATVGTRAAMKLHRRLGDRAHESVGGLVDAFVADEPELALAKARHGPELAASLRTALASLEPRQLLLLRLHHAQGWSVDRLGAMYKVGRSTAARWVGAAREALVETAKRDLRARLKLTSTELDSLVALLQSNLEVSLVRLLEDGAKDGTPEQGDVGA